MITKHNKPKEFQWISAKNRPNFFEVFMFIQKKRIMFGVSDNVIQTN